MAPISNELFLLSCINHSTAGKIDFKKVGQDCEMKPSAASMRFSRFKAKHDTTLLKGSGAAKDKEGTPASSEDPKKAPTKKDSAKKRKLNEVDDDESIPIKREKGDK